MCGRYTLAKADRVQEVVMNVTMKADLRNVGRFNIAPSQDVLVVVIEGSTGPVAEMMRWGLVPSWAKDPSVGNMMINARVETLAEKPAYRKALERRRCIIPADGFYEWRKNADGTKTPMYVRRKDGRAFGFAGLWETWKDPQGQELRTCTIITTNANDLLKPIHERMPVILEPDAVTKWLNTANNNVLPLLKPLESSELEAYPVSRAVNSARSEGEELIQPVEDTPIAESKPEARKSKRPRKSDPGQGSLF